MCLQLRSWKLKRSPVGGSGKKTTGLPQSGRGVKLVSDHSKRLRWIYQQASAVPVLQVRAGRHTTPPLLRTCGFLVLLQADCLFSASPRCCLTATMEVAAETWDGHRREFGFSLWMKCKPPSLQPQSQEQVGTMWENVNKNRFGRICKSSKPHIYQQSIYFVKVLFIFWGSVILPDIFLL